MLVLFGLRVKFPLSYFATKHFCNFITHFVCTLAVTKIKVIKFSLKDSFELTEKPFNPDNPVKTYHILSVIKLTLY